MPCPISAARLENSLGGPALGPVPDVDADAAEPLAADPLGALVEGPAKPGCRWRRSAIARNSGVRSRKLAGVGSGIAPQLDGCLPQVLLGPICTVRSAVLVVLWSLAGGFHCVPREPSGGLEKSRAHSFNVPCSVPCPAAHVCTGPSASQTSDSHCGHGSRPSSALQERPSETASPCLSRAHRVGGGTEESLYGTSVAAAPGAAQRAFGAAARVAWDAPLSQRTVSGTDPAPQQSAC